MSSHSTKDVREVELIRAAVVRPNKVDEYPCKRNRVVIPFYEEYAVRVTNKTYGRIGFAIFVDGEPVLGEEGGMFILNSRQTTVIERRLNGSLTEGRKFQWLPSEHGEVAHKVDEPERGIVEIRAWKEKPYVPPTQWTYFEKTVPSWNDDILRNLQGNGFINSGGSSVGAVSSCMAMSTGTAMANALATDTGTFDSDGATGEGSHSGQSFSKVYGFEKDEGSLHVVRFYLNSPDAETKVSTQTYKVGHTYCRHCGAKARTKSDRYCWKCGERL